MPLFGTDDGRRARATAALGIVSALLFEEAYTGWSRARRSVCSPSRARTTRSCSAPFFGLLRGKPRGSADFTNTFRSLTSGRLIGDATTPIPKSQAWHRRLAKRAAARQPQSPVEGEDLMRRHNPAFIPRNHNVEAALHAATSTDDYSVMARLLDVLATPYDHGRDLPMFSTSSSGEQPYRTFCGT